MRFFLTVFFAVAVLFSAIPSACADLDALLNFKSKSNYNNQALNKNRLSDGDAGSGYLLEQNELIGILQEQLVDEYKSEGRLVLYPLQQWNGLKLPSSAWDIELVKMPGGVLSSKFTLRFKIIENGELLGRWQMPVVCELWQKAYVSNKQINSRAALNEMDFSVQEIDALRTKKSVVTRMIDIRKYEARQSISSNRPLFWRDVTPRSMVGKGEMVNVVASEGLLQINMHALALEDGAYGDVINLRNKDSNKRIQAEVIDENKVRIYL